MKGHQEGKDSSVDTGLGLAGERKDKDDDTLRRQVDGK